MPRPRNRDEVVDTLYFSRVTPTWVPPNASAIPERYQPAINSLADWAGPSWHESSDFFWVRDRVVEQCERYVAYDWDVDTKTIEYYKTAPRDHAELFKSFRRFKRLLDLPSFQNAKRILALSVLEEFSPDSEINISYQEGMDATDRALISFGEYLSNDPSPLLKYGPIEFEQIPRSLPKRSLAMALSLSDCISVFRVRTR